MGLVLLPPWRQSGPPGTPYLDLDAANYSGGTWPDTSGSGLHATLNSASGTTAPALSSLNGHTTVAFNGTSNRLATAATASLPATITVWAVAAAGTVSPSAYRRIVSAETLFYLGSTSAGNQTFGSFYGSGSGWGTIAGWGTNTLTPGTLQILASRNTGTDFASINGVSVGSRSNAMAAFSGQIIGVGAGAGNINQCWDGHIARILIYASADATLAAQVLAYLQNIYS